MVIYWVGLVLVTVDAATWIWDLLRYKVWDKEYWGRHMESSITTARSDFKRGWHKNMYTVMMWSLGIVESVAYVYSAHMISEALNIHWVWALVIALYPICVMVYNTLRSIRLTRMAENDFKKLKMSNQDVYMFTSLMVGQTVYGCICVLLSLMKVFYMF